MSQEPSNFNIDSDGAAFSRSGIFIDGIHSSSRFGRLLKLSLQGMTAPAQFTHHGHPS